MSKNDNALSLDEVLISRKALRYLTVVFVIGLLVPMGLRIFSGPVQKIGQEASHRQQLSLLKEGNRKVHVGKDGWLYYRPGLDSLTGYGPLKHEPAGVMKNPDRKEWRDPLPVIIRFAEQLRERGIELMLVPVPDKAAIHPEGIIPGDSRIRVHPDREKIFDKLSRAGIEMIDLVPLFENLKEKGQDVFLKQDTHWRPEAMQLAAREVAQALGGKPLQNQTGKKFSRSHVGDLIDMLDVGDQAPFAPEKIILTQLPLSKGESPIVLLGDSFVNIYDDPSLGFGVDGESRIGAGFAAHLGANLGYPVEIFAINGDGATATRQAFASQSDDFVRSKKQVVWLIAERDLFMARSTALAANVFWRDVEFSKKVTVKAAAPIVITARLIEKSRIRDPKQVNYPDAIYSAKFDSIKVLSGDFPADDSAVIFLWAFREKKLLPTAHIKEGQVYHLTLLPLLSHPSAGKTKQLDDFFSAELPMFAEGIEEWEGGKVKSGKSK